MFRMKTAGLSRMAQAVGEALSWKLLEIGARTGMIAFALPLEISDKSAFEKLPEAQRGLYKEEDGKWRLEVDGLEDTSGLKSALEKERDARRKAENERKEFAKRYEGIDPDKVRDLMSHFENKEEAELLKQGSEGIQKIVEKRIAKAQEAWNKEKQGYEEKVAGAHEVASTFMEQVLNFRIMEAALKAGVHQHAMEDVILRAKQIFDVDEEGRAVQFDQEDNIVPGKNGKDPYSVAEWLESMTDKAPHWFEANNSGGGAGGNRKPNLSGKKTMKRTAFEAMDQGERMKFTKEGGVVVD